MGDELKKISANRAKKEQIVAELSDKMGKAKAIVFTNYQGLTHRQIEELKKAIKPAEGEFIVAKNSLVLRSLNDRKFGISDEEKLNGPTGTLLMYGDIVEPLKALAKTIKQLNLPNIKFGILESKEITAEEVAKISTLPSKEILIAQFVGELKSPIFGLHRALNWNLQKFVLTLSAISKSKPAEPMPAAQAVEEKAETPVPQPEVQPEPEAISNETNEEKAEEKPAGSEPVEPKNDNPTIETQVNEGGEN